MKKYKANLAIDINKVLSYGTHVATIDYEKKELHIKKWYSQTTTKHCNYVASELGLTIIEPTK